MFVVLPLLFPLFILKPRPCLSFQPSLNSQRARFFKFNDGPFIKGERNASSLQEKHMRQICFHESYAENPVDDESTLLFTVSHEPNQECINGGNEFNIGCLVQNITNDKKSYQIWILPPHSKIRPSENYDTLHVDEYESMLHVLVLRYLHMEWEHNQPGLSEEKNLGIELRLDKCNNFRNDHYLRKAVDVTGFQATSDENVMRLDLETFLYHLHEFSFAHQGSDHSIYALDVLGFLSKRRVSFDFNPSVSFKRKGRGIVLQQRHMLPTHVVEKVSRTVNTVKSNGWLSTNPDSVDGLPSLHINLISDGTALFPHDERKVAVKIEGGEGNFEEHCAYIHDVVEPYIYDSILPSVREIVGSNTVEVSDVFLRSYGTDAEDNQDDSIESEENCRFGLSAHYDVLSSLTWYVSSLLYCNFFGIFYPSSQYYNEIQCDCS